MKTLHTKEEYDQAFNSAQLESRSEYYAELDMLEVALGFAVSKSWLDQTARVLNCPVKVNAANWQHGRVIYTVLRNRLNGKTPTDERPMAMVDIGTAKGFSACVIALALKDSGNGWDKVPVHTTDVIDPEKRVARNTVAEVDGLKTLHETMVPFIPEGTSIVADGSGSVKLLSELKNRGTRVPFAFVDGKHTHTAVYAEGVALASMQQEGDVVVFDDCQITDVRLAIHNLKRLYVTHLVTAGPRIYAVARRVA